MLFINDKRPHATTETGTLQGEEDWEVMSTVVERGASLGSGVIVLGGVRIGIHASIGAGAVVTKDVSAGETVAGNPARSLVHALGQNVQTMSREEECNCPPRGASRYKGRTDEEKRLKTASAVHRTSASGRAWSRIQAGF